MGDSSLGTLSGFFAAPITAVAALAPWAGAALAEGSCSYAAAFTFLAGVVVLAAALAWRGGASERPAP